MIFIARTVYRSSFVKVSITEAELSPNELKRGCRLGSDSHCDTSVVGKHAKITAVIEGQTVEAFPFAKSFGSIKNLPIVNAAVAYDHPVLCRTFILHLNHSIFVGEDSDNSLLCPNQLRANGVQLDDRPKIYEPLSTFSIYFPAIDLHLPFRSYGPTAYISIRRPTEDEYEQCDHLDLTDPDGWDPYQEPSNHGFYVSSISRQAHVYEEHPFDDELLQHTLISKIKTIPIISAERSVSSLSIKEKLQATPERIAKLWGCGLDTAKRTLEATTHKAYREYLNSTGSLTRRFRTRLAQLRYRQLALPHGAMYSDTMLSKIRSIRGFTCGQLFCNDQWFVKFYPMKQKSDAPDTLKMFHQDVGIPPSMHTDNAQELVQGEFSKLNRKMGTKQTSIEPKTPNQNRAELCMREFKKRISRLMARRNVPLRLWCFVAEYIADIMCLTATPLAKLQGRTSYEFIFGHTPDISEFIEFEFYDWVWYWDTEADYPEEKKRLGRWLGVAHRVGQGMCYYILSESSKIIVRSTLSSLADDEGNVEDVSTKQSFFTSTLENNIGNFRNAIVNKDDQDIILDSDFAWYKFCLDDNSDDSGVQEPADSEDNMVSPDKVIDDFPDREELDNYIGAQVVLPSKDGESLVLTRVTNRKRDSDDRVLGRSHDNPILDTRVYQVEYPDGATAEFSANVIAENILSQVETDGFNFSYLSEIIGHRSNEQALSKENGLIQTKSGLKPIITTKGWEIYVKWKDQSTSWVTLKDLKESDPVLLAEYAVTNDIQTEPAFKWWVPYTLRKREAIIAKVNSRFKKKNIKFGIEVPSSVEEALELDRRNGNDHWGRAIKKEMDAVEVAFKFKGIGEKAPPGYKKITCHIIFDVKFDLTRKARYVAGGHLTDPPSYMTYSSVVSRDSVRICLTVAALNGLNISACDIGNAYLNAETKEKVYFVAGSEWRDNEGRIVIIVRALYGLRSSALQWQKHLADNLRYDLGYSPSLADNNVWLKQCHKPDGERYYSYILCFVDDLLCIHLEPDSILSPLKGFYKMKHEPSMPSMYLGSDISTFDHESGTCFAMGSDSYVKEAVRVVKQRMSEEGVKFRTSKKTPQSPFTCLSYRAELDLSEECNPEQAAYFQNLVGVLRWIIELGRVDILTEVSILSRYLASPRSGHLHQAMHVFHYLESHNRSKIALNPTHIDWSEENEPGNCYDTPSARAQLMKELYPEASEEIPPNMPEPLGKPVQINAFFDADHAGDRVTRRSQSGIIIFLGLAPIIWYSKRQNSVEVSSFGSEFVAMRIGVEMVKALRYKLRMFGIPIEGSANVFCDHQSVVTNVSTPESVLRRKHNSIAYHFCREAIASKMIVVRKVLSEHNIADLFTKCLPPRARQYLSSKITV